MRNEDFTAPDPEQVRLLAVYEQAVQQDLRAEPPIGLDPDLAAFVKEMAIQDRFYDQIIAPPVSQEFLQEIHSIVEGYKTDNA